MTTFFAPMVSFDNTENAFRARTSQALNRSYWLFRLIGSHTLVRIGSAVTPAALRLGFKPMVKATIYKQFVGGETIADCEPVIAALSHYNIGTILDYSVEGKEDEKDFENCFQETLRTIARARNDERMPFCVFKVTGLARLALLEKVSAGATLRPAEKEEWERARQRVNRICATAAEAGQPVFIDAEESWIQQAIDDLADSNMKVHNKSNTIVYNTYQLYRHDRLAFLEKSIHRAQEEGYKLGAKLVRGAYMEKERERASQKGYPSPIQPDKAATDRDYDKALKLCADNDHLVSVCAGTHNEDSSRYLVQLMKEKAVTPGDKRYYFSQLYGMSDHISYNLSVAGYNVAKYVPYGPVNEVLPYLIRRAQENTSVKGQTGRELSLIMKEKRRRKSAGS